MFHPVLETARLRLRRWREDEVERTERAAFQVATHVDDKVTYDLRMTD